MKAEVMEEMRTFLFNDMEIRMFGDGKLLGLLEKIFNMIMLELIIRKLIVELEMVYVLNY